MNEGKYNIKAICTMLGIQPGTLRAWERRYHIISPIRNEAGHRLYTEEHVKILKWLMEKVQEGFTIGQAVSLLESNQHVQLEEEENKAAVLADKITKALLNFDEYKATDYVNESFSLFSVDKVMIDIFARVLITVGELWEEGAITTAHEHFATSYLRTRIGMVYQHLPVNPVLPKVIAVCGPNEQHELGLLIFTIFLRRRGFQMIYLGASVLEEDLKIVIDEVRPKLLFLACSYIENVTPTLKLVENMEKIHPDLIIGLGGAAFVRETKVVDSRYVGGGKEEWEAWLQSKLANLS